MKIDTKIELKTLEGETLREGNTEDGKALTFGRCCVQSLLSNDAKLDAKGKLEQYQLAMKINNAEEGVDLTVKDWTKIQECAAVGWTIFIYGQICDIIEAHASKE